MEETTISSLSIADLNEILDNTLNFLGKDVDWYSLFPRVSGYDYMYPHGYEDIEDFPNHYREDDHAIAAKAVKCTELHEKIISIITQITKLNKSSGIIWAEPYEHAGTCFAVELSLFDSKYVSLYADFLFSNDISEEQMQSFDVVKIVRKWGLNIETYYLLLTYWFMQGDLVRSDLDYLTYNGFSIEKKLQTETDVEVFIQALTTFISQSSYSKEEFKDSLFPYFEELVDDYIFSREKGKNEFLKKTYCELVENFETIQNDNHQKNLPDISLKQEDEFLPEI